MWTLKQQKPNSQNKITDLWLQEAERMGRGNWRNLVKRNRLPVKKRNMY